LNRMWKQGADEFIAAIQQAGALFGSILEDLAVTGGKNFSEVVLHQLSGGFQKLGEGIALQIAKVVGPITGDTQSGFSFGGRSFATQQGAQVAQAQQAQQFLAYAQAAAGLAAIGIASSRGQLSTGQAALQGASVGSGLGLGLIGAAAGAIIGAVIQLATEPSPVIARYFQPGMKDRIWEMVGQTFGI